jgi:hypothetical protein
MGFKRKIKRFDYQPRYYKGEGNPYEIKHKFDKFRSTVGPKKGIKGKINSAVNDLKGGDMSVEYEDEVFEMQVQKDHSKTIILFTIGILVLIFLYIIDFDLSIFYNEK